MIGRACGHLRRYDRTVDIRDMRERERARARESKRERESEREREGGDACMRYDVKGRDVTSRLDRFGDDIIR